MLKPRANVRIVACQSAVTNNVNRRRFLFNSAFLVPLVTVSTRNLAVAKPQGGLDLSSCRNYKDSENGLKYCDVVVGDKDSPFEGDLVVIDYTARVGGPGGPIYDGSKGFKFTLGNQEVIAGQEMAIVGTDGMPAIQIGGIRTVLIPPDLAYGQEGYLCLFGREKNCMVPPNTPVEITFKFVGYGY